MNLELECHFKCTRQFTFYIVLALIPFLILLGVITVLLYFCIVGEDEEWKIMAPLILFLVLLFIGGVYFAAQKIKLFILNPSKNKVVGVNIIQKKLNT